MRRATRGALLALALVLLPAALASEARAVAREETLDGGHLDQRLDAVGSIDQFCLGRLVDAHARQYQLHLDTCTCDLTANMCDAVARCSCDPDCSAADKALFAAASAPTPASYLFNPPALPNATYCVSSDVATYNTRGDLSVSILNNLLCVSAVNNPSTALFLNGVTAMSSAQVTSTLASQAATLRTFERPALVASTPANAGSSYIVLDRIGALSSANLSVGKLGYLPIPTRGFGTECSDSHFARFNEPFVPTAPCLRVTYDLAGACTASSPLLSAKYWTSLQLAKYTGATPDMPNSFVPITVRSVSRQVVATSTSLAARSLLATTDPLYANPQPTYTNVGLCKCADALYELGLTLQYSSAGVVTGAVADIVVADVTAPFITGSTVCTGNVAIAPQTFSLAFNATASTASSAPAPRSGAPGYIVGLPVLAGYAVTDPAGTGKVAVAPVAAGLTVPGSNAAGACSTDAYQRVPVVFGQDANVVCTVALSQAQLASRCQSVSLSAGAAAVIAAGVGLWEFMTMNVTNIGMFGDAKSVNVADWVTFVQATPVSSMTWNAVTHSCDAMSTTMNIQLFYSLAGSTLAPQAVITAAKLSYTYTTVRSELGAATTNVPVGVAVSFIYVPASTLTTYLPPIPPSLPQLPADVLYPLYIGAAPRVGASAALVGVCALAAALSAFF